MTLPTLIAGPGRAEVERSRENRRQSIGIPGREQNVVSEAFGTDPDDNFGRPEDSQVLVSAGLPAQLPHFGPLHWPLSRGPVQQTLGGHPQRIGGSGVRHGLVMDHSDIPGQGVDGQSQSGHTY